MADYTHFISNTTKYLTILNFDTHTLTVKKYYNILTKMVTTLKPSQNLVTLDIKYFPTTLT